MHQKRWEMIKRNWTWGKFGENKDSLGSFMTHIGVFEIYVELLPNAKWKSWWESGRGFKRGESPVYDLFDEAVECAVAGIRERNEICELELQRDEAECRKTAKAKARFQSQE